MKGLGVACALALALAWAANAGAEEPSGSYAIAIGALSGLVVPTGGAELCQDGVCVSTDVATDVDGAVTGSANIQVDGGATADIDLDLGGKLSGTTAKPKVQLAFLATGMADGFAIEGKGKLKCAAGEADGLLDCTGKAKLCAFQLGQKLGCQSLPFATQVAFVRQAFTLNLDLSTVLGSTVAGEANAQIGALTVASYTVKGKYKSAEDAATLALDSADPEQKTKVALKHVMLAGGVPTAGTALFKLMGQKGTVELPTP